MNTKKLTIYVAVTYGLTALLAWGYTALGGEWGSPGSMVISALAMFSPLVGTVIAQRTAGEPVWAGLGARPKLSRWLLIGCGIALLNAVLATGIGLLMPGIEYSSSLGALIERYGSILPAYQLVLLREQLAALPVHPALLALPQAAVAGLTVNALFAFGEEIGWRGFLQRELSSLGFWGASLATGVIWGLWHAPLILHGHNYPEHPIAGVFIFVVVCVLLSPLLSWVRVRSGSVWAAAVLHGTFNASAGLPLLLSSHDDELLIGLPGLAGIISLAMLCIALRAHLGPRPAGYLRDSSARSHGDVFRC